MKKIVKKRTETLQDNCNTVTNDFKNRIIISINLNFQCRIRFAILETN